MQQSDAFGRFLLDQLDRSASLMVIERDDGFVFAAGGYLSPRRNWAAVERRALRFLSGRVVDVGCGAGRLMLELQSRGQPVVGIDSSPGAVEVARRRGAGDVRLLRAEDLVKSVGEFDTVAMFGNNLGLLGGERKGRTMLRRLHAVTSAKGRIVGSTHDPKKSSDPADAAYGERNGARGRMAGQLRLRIRYRNIADPWFDYLFMSPDELRAISAGTGWRVSRTIEGTGPMYVAILEKERSRRSASGTQRTRGRTDSP